MKADIDVQVCYRCGGDMLPGETTYCHTQDGRIWLFEHVPALICDQCGERSYPGHVVEHIQQTIWDDAAPTRTIEASVYDLTTMCQASAQGD